MNAFRVSPFLIVFKNQKAAARSLKIRSGGVYGARRKFPKEVSSERKFSFLSDFLSVSRRITRKSAIHKK